MLRAVRSGSLLLWDRNFHRYALLTVARRCGAPVLGRLPSGAAVVAFYPSDHRRDPPDALRVWLLPYTLTDPARPGCGETQRLIPTLLDPALAPAVDLICADHERWETAVTIDEPQTHQRRASQPLRSRRPVGVRQGCYALLLAHYAVRILMYTAACLAALDLDRLSFVAAGRLIQDAIPEFQQTAPQQPARVQAHRLQVPAQTPRTCLLAPTGRTVPHRHHTYLNGIALQPPATHPHYHARKQAPCPHEPTARLPVCLTCRVV